MSMKTTTILIWVISKRFAPSTTLSMWKARYTLYQVCHLAVANLGQALTSLTIGIGEGISRIVKGLQTIMLPSMQQQHPRSPKSKAPSKPNILSTPSLKNSGSIGNIEWTQFRLMNSTPRRSHWRSGSIQMIPGLRLLPLNHLYPSCPQIRAPQITNHTTPAGFDDDFSSFASAPAPAPAPETTDLPPKARWVR